LLIYPPGSLLAAIRDHGLSWHGLDLPGICCAADACRVAERCRHAWAVTSSRHAATIALPDGYIAEVSPPPMGHAVR